MKTRMAKVAPALIACLVGVSSLAGTGAARAEALELAPDRTWAVIAGVLTWPDQALSSFSPAGRKDQALYDTLAARGVPQDQMALMLDGEATTAAILSAVERLAGRAGPGDTLIVYYAGHGMKRPDGSFVFASYDTNTRDLARTGLHLRALQETLEKSYRGGRLVLLADCCYSGGLGRVAEALANKGVRAVSLTSAEASNVSTANWTFTQALVDGLSGSDLCDDDKDGQITLDELRGEVSEAMKYREEQRYGWANFGVPVGWVLASGARRWDGPEARGARYKRGEWVMATRRGKPAVARVMQRTADGKGYVVSFYDYHQRVEATFAESKLGPVQWPTYAVGDRLRVSWYGRHFEARVTRAEAPFYRVTYPGWGSEWDEWVGPRRIIAKLLERKPGEPERAKDDTGERVQVEWGGRWWPAEVTGRSGERICVHYVGYDASWDECVVPARVRRTGASESGGQSKALVEWQGQWYPAVVMAEKATKAGRLWHIHYVGYDASWDEWVADKRIRFPERRAR